MSASSSHIHHQLLAEHAAEDDEELFDVAVTLKIVDPISDTDDITPNANLIVTITTDQPTLLHELILFKIPTLDVSQRTTFIPSVTTNRGTIPIPADVNADYFLELGLAPSATPQEQIRHRIVISTAAGTALAVTLSGIPNALTGANTTVAFTAHPTGGNGNYNFYSLHTGDGPDDTSLDPTISHTFTVGGTFNVTVTVRDSAGHTATSVTPLLYTAPIAVSVSVSILGSPTPGAYAGPFAVAFTAIPTGGTGSYTNYAFTVKNLATGMTFATQSTVSPVFSTTLVAGATYAVHVVITDSSGATFTSTPDLYYTIT